MPQVSVEVLWLPVMSRETSHGTLCAMQTVPPTGVSRCRRGSRQPMVAAGQLELPQTTTGGTGTGRWDPRLRRSATLAACVRQSENGAAPAPGARAWTLAAPRWLQTWPPPRSCALTECHAAPLAAALESGTCSLCLPLLHVACEFVLTRQAWRANYQLAVFASQSADEPGARPAVGAGRGEAAPSETSAPP